MTTPDEIRSARFRREREGGWRQLEAIVTVTERRGIAALSFDEARLLAQLYRQAMASLSVAREITLDRALLAYLEALCGRAYLAVYAPHETVRGVLWRFVSRGAPRAVRRSTMVLLAAALTMTLGALVGFQLFLVDPSWFNVFVPAEVGQGRGLASSRAELLETLAGGGEQSTGMLGAFAAVLFSRNTGVAILAFGLGIGACVPSFLLVFYNGLILGSLFALYDDRGVGFALFAWLSVHGVTELLAIIIAAAGGYQLGIAVLFPGRMTRRAALRRAGRDAVKLAVLAAGMLIVAALLEGFVRQLVGDPIARIAIGWGIGAVWLTYFVLAGRGGEAAT